MTCIFGSLLVTPCALTSCHAVISKQGSAIRAVGYNRCVTGRRPRDENHAVRFRQREGNRESSEGHAADQSVSRKKIWEEVLSLSTCLVISFSTNQKTVGPFRK